jgi:hypothetical protein
MAVKWITHKGRRILYVDYQECETESDLITLLEESTRMIVSQPGKVRLLSNFRGVAAGPGYMNRVAEAGADISRNKLEKSAIIGIGGLTSILVGEYFRSKGDKNNKVLETMEEARDWLATVG